MIEIFKLYKRKHHYFVSYAHPKGFGSFVIKDVQVLAGEEDMPEYFKKRISEHEKNIGEVVILNFIKLKRK